MWLNVSGGPLEAASASGASHSLPTRSRVQRALVALLLSLIAWLGSSGTLVVARVTHDSSLGLPAFAKPRSARALLIANLGKRLFSDSRLSSDGKVSCTTCHQPQHAFSDGRRVARGVDNKLGTRNTPSLLNVRYNSTEFWDGRSPSLEAQAVDPLTNPLEHGLRNTGDLMQRIQSDTTYLTEFRAAFSIPDHQAIGIDQVAEALATFERTLVAGDSAFDRYLYGHEAGALSEAAQRGLVLFRGRAQCANCHAIGDQAALFMDNQYHSINVGLLRLTSRLAQLAAGVVRSRNAGTRTDTLIPADAGIAELGRFVLTLDPVDIGKFRTPSLRNVALTAPYMHDGSIATLEEAVDRELYDHAGDGRPLILTPLEKTDLVAFLRSLTSPAAAKSIKIQGLGPIKIAVAQDSP
jgi:cytochrome c peroxidase